MGKVVFQNSISLDGFVAGPNDNPDNGLGDGGDALFAWYNSGDSEFPLPGTDMVFHVSKASAEFLKEEWFNLGAMICGRRMFDISRAWGGYPPGGGPCFVLTHTPDPEWVKPGSPFIFVSDGIESAVRQAQQAAGDQLVSTASASILQQCIKAGLQDEIILDVAPVLLGSGVRLFDNLDNFPLGLEQIGSIQGQGVTHLKYRVLK